MAEARPNIAVVVADEGWPPGLDPGSNEAAFYLVSTLAEFDAIAADLDALVVYDFRTRILHEADWSGAPNVRWIHAASAGVDAVLAPPVIERGITVTNSRGVFDQAIAEYVLGLMLMVVKDLGRTVRLQGQRSWLHRDTAMLRAKRLLVVGAGSIGLTIGRLAFAAGMRVEGIARSARSAEPFERVGGPEDLIDALGRADFVVIATPLTPETHGLFDTTAFGAMQSDAWLINVGRGAVVEEPALIEALEKGQLGGAALDVFSEEPLRPDHPFWDMDNVLVSPHMSGDFTGWLEELSAVFLENLRRWRAGEALLNVVA